MGKLNKLLYLFLSKSLLVTDNFLEEAVAYDISKYKYKLISTNRWDRIPEAMLETYWHAEKTSNWLN